MYSYQCYRRSLGQTHSFKVYHLTLSLFFPPAHPDVGDLKIWDDGNEAIIEIGDISHGHFGWFTKQATQEDIEQEVAENILDFLEELFADNYLLWRSKSGQAGGWRHIRYSSTDDWWSRLELDADKFVWSGPI